MIVPMEKKHATEVGELHHKYVKSLLGDLGKQMCITFYKTILKSEENFGFVYVENSKVQGFIFGTTDNSRLFKHPRILFGIGISALKNPLIIKNLLYRFIHKYPPGPESSYVAVDLKLRGKGIAKKLSVVQHETFKKKGIKQLVGCIEEDNKANLALQQKLGAKVVGELYQRGKRIYVLHIPTTLP